MKPCIKIVTGDDHEIGRIPITHEQLDDFVSKNYVVGNIGVGRLFKEEHPFYYMFPMSDRSLELSNAVQVLMHKEEIDGIKYNVYITLRVPEECAFAIFLVLKTTKVQQRVLPVYVPQCMAKELTVGKEISLRVMFP